MFKTILIVFVLCTGFFISLGVNEFCDLVCGSEYTHYELRLSNTTTGQSMIADFVSKDEGIRILKFDSGYTSVFFDEKEIIAGYDIRAEVERNHEK